MKAKFSKILASVLALTLMFTLLVVTSSAGTLEKQTENTIDPSLAEALSCVEIQKEEYGLSTEDLYGLRIGEPIQTYIYSDDSFIAWQTLYPILSGKKLILWAVEVEGSYQISQGLVRELSNVLDYDEAFAIVYDYDSVYLYSNDSFRCLGHFEGQDDSRSKLNVSSVNQGKLITQSLSENKEVNYLPGKAKSQNYYSCNVDFVTQDIPYVETSYICWAATIACIVNYHNGTKWTATYVAADIKGPNFNHGVDEMFYPVAMQYFRNHGVGTYLPYTNAMPSTYSIIDNLQHGYPLYSNWDLYYYKTGYFLNASHAMCIYGIFTANNYISIMDPNSDNGFATVAADPNSGNGAGYCSYTYYDTTSGVYATLIEAIYSTSFS